MTAQTHPIIKMTNLINKIRLSYSKTNHSEQISKKLIQKYQEDVKCRKTFNTGVKFEIQMALVINGSRMMLKEDLKVNKQEKSFKIIYIVLQKNEDEK